MDKKFLMVGGILFIIVLFGFIQLYNQDSQDDVLKIKNDDVQKNANEDHDDVIQEKISVHPMAIESLRLGLYPGGDFVVEKELPNGTNYQQSIVSYRSEGLKIYGLLTVPLAPRPENGFPAIVFVHGYIQPDQYSTTGNYPTYQATLARAGFVTFKPDLRGHGNSEGEPVIAHFSEKYVVDTLNAIAYMKDYVDIDQERIGYWGHSNGGEIGLRVAVVSNDIKAYVLWAGVVGSYKDMFETYNDKIPFLKDRTNPLVAEHGLPSERSDFWNMIEPYAYLNDISAPVQLYHGTRDKSVPVELSIRLNEELKKLGKEVEYFAYEGDDHNIGNNSGVAFRETIKFFESRLSAKTPSL